MLNNKCILITGGTGSFGNKFTETVLKKYCPKKLIIFSRDEYKQFEMQKRFPEKDYPIRYFLGDVRDLQRLHRAFYGVDFVIHAAALKQVPAAEYNPFEFVNTNVLGSENIINAAIDQKVKRVLALSTDKAVNPINLYGATKLCAEKLFIAGNNYSGDANTKFSVVRYGNVVGSRGSVIPLFLEKRKTGTVPITDANMTRFWITLEQTVLFVLKMLEIMGRGEIFIPIIPSMRIMNIYEAIASDCKYEIIGIRPGEKLHEVLMTEEESLRCRKDDQCFCVYPDSRVSGVKHDFKGEKLKEPLMYSSGNNDKWMTSEELKKLISKHVEQKD